MIKFEVERIDGLIKFTPEKLDVNMVIGLVRTTSSDEKTSNKISFKYKDKLYNPKEYLDPYGFPQYINSFPIYNGGEYIKDISEFNFDEVPDNIKLKVELFEHQPINTKRIL